jgi:ATP-dependent exoDNAse (exonuclease V) beta subunit
MTKLKVLDASAGSGKTFSIVQDFLERCLAEPDRREYRRVLAITFTNKAATEMKSRILRALEQFSSGELSGPDKIMFENLQDLLRIDAISLKERSSIVLHQILHDFARFDVGTIDQFTARIVRTFAQDLKLPAQFDISLDFNELLDQAVQLLLEKVGEDDELTAHLKGFIEERIRNNESWRVERDILDVGGMLGENHHRQELEMLLSLSLEELFGAYKSIRAERYQLESTICKKAVSLIESLNSVGLHRSGMGQMAGWIHGLLRKWTEVDQFPLGKLQLSVSIQAFLSGDKSLFPAKMNPEQQAISPQEEKIRSDCEEGFTELVDLGQRYFSLKLVQKPFPGILVLKELDEVLQHYQNENRLIHISNFNRLIAQEIQGQAMPFIYERLGERYDHYYLDEFQDTSELQWNNLFPLIHNALSEFGGSCLIVGDAKQAIYRWRGGKLEQFVRLTERKLPRLSLSGEGLTAPYSIESDSLKTNWRSKENIVSFVKSLFKENAGILQLNAYKKIFSDIAQKAHQEKGGYVELYRTEDSEIDDKLLHWIQDLRHRGYKNKDICILVKKNKEGGQIAQLLASNQIPVISGDSLLLSSSPEANALANALCYLSLPEHDEARARLLLYLQFRDKEGKWGLDHWQAAFDSSEASDFLLENSFDWAIPFRSLTQLGLYEAAEHLQQALGLGKRSPAFIQLMMNAIDELEDKKHKGLAEFEAWWIERQAKISLQEPESVDAVRIMTIHKSKGLEFPIVIIPFANWLYRLDRRDRLWLDLDPNEWYGLSKTFVSPSSSMEWMSPSFCEQYQSESERNLLDSMNVLYVALTRAAEELYVGLPKNAQKGASIRDWFNDLLKDSDHFSMGKPSLGKHSDTQVENSLGPYRSNYWRGRIRVSQPSFRSDAMQRGEWVHELLARFKNKEQLKHSIGLLVKQGELEIQRSDQLYEEILQFLQIPAFSSYLETSDEVVNERELLDSEGKIYRPDRILIHGTKVRVIDFKTGEESNAHKQQLEHYSDLLRETGFEVVERALLYLDLKKVVSW